MNTTLLKKSLLTLALATIPVFAVVFWRALSTEPTLPTLTEKAEKAGVAMLTDLRSLPAKEIKEEKEAYLIEEDGKDGIDIAFKEQGTGNKEQKTEEKPKTTLSLPKDYGKPIEVKLDDQRAVLITDLSGNKDYASVILSDSEGSNSSVIARESSTAAIQGSSSAILNTVKDLLGLDSSSSTQNDEQLGNRITKYLAYTSPDERKTHLYAYQKDQANGEKKLKSWTLYQYGLGKETESYKIENAKVKIDDDGNAQVFFFGQSDMQSEQAKADVDPSLMDRAQKFLQQETGNDIMNDTNRTPDFTIPKPTYFTKDGAEHEAEWKVLDSGSGAGMTNSEGSSSSVIARESSTAAIQGSGSSVILSVAITENPNAYPIALDPTLSFTAPGSTSGGDTIMGEGGSFGNSLASGDFNADGRTDLVVGASGYSTNTGRVYIFYNDGSITSGVPSADAIISGETTSNYFGISIKAGDWNADGKDDLAVGAYYYNSFQGRAYLFYGGSIITENASGADVTLTGETTSNYFGYSLATGDLNSDGKDDLAVGAYRYNTYQGRVYIFYGGSMISENATGADVTLTGEATIDYFSRSLITGDFNQDGKDDLAVGADWYGSLQGRVYIFYGGSMISENATGADVTMTGETTDNNFGYSLATGDFNVDGKDDIAVGAYGYNSTYQGRVYIFYGGSMISENATGADVTLAGETTDNNFGYSLVSGDFNQDGKTDLVAGAYGYSSSIGRAYIFYGGSMSSENASGADVIITGESTGNNFSKALASGDFNSDGKTDLVVGAYGYASGKGKTYIFYSQNGQINTNKSIAGESTNQDFGRSFAAGDWNADGKTDLAVGAENYDTGSSNVGRVYIFYNDGSYPTGGATADVIITGEAVSNCFGRSIITGDFNADGKTDLAVGADGYSTSTGRAYVFYNGSIITENASGADIIITGEASSQFGYSGISGDFNADGRTDLVVGSRNYSSGTGRAYVFWGGSIITEAATGADAIITGYSTFDYFSLSFTSGDFNQDGKIDLVVGEPGFGGDDGRVYIFYNGSIVTEANSGADVIIAGGATSQFGDKLVSGDFNQDGTIDLVVGAFYYSTSTGRVHVFYNDGSIPTTAANADIIILGEASSSFGTSLVAGDFNADGRTDLAASAFSITTNTGKAYIFHNDGSIPTTAVTADVVITGETTNNYFGWKLAAGDWNADGRTDLVVGAYGNTTNTGKIYFYETRENFAWQVQPVSGLRTSPNFSGQEMKITGESGTTGTFGNAFAAGDFNQDGKTDLAVGASAYNSNTGRVYLFYNDGSITPGAPSADVIISGEASSRFGAGLTAGDFNQDGKTDLAVGASTYNSNTGRVYLFYNDGSITPGAPSADVIISGEAASDFFGSTLVFGDLNADGKTDLVVGAYGYNPGGASNTGRVYLFYNGSIITENASGADVIIQGEAAGNIFGTAMVAGDFNADGKTDLVVSANSYDPGGAAGTGRAYIFYGGSIITENASGADVIIQGEATLNYFGALISGDFNADGKTDLAIGAHGYSTNTGRVYIFYADGTNNFGTATCSGTPAYCLAANADVKITGETTNNYFGLSLTSGDFNADGKVDLAVGAFGYSSSTGRAYVFYNDGSIPTTAATADLILQGEATSNGYGAALAAGDFNGDGKIDLIVGANSYGGSKGRAYLYTFQDGVITGEATNNYFGWAMTNGDFNADGRTDLAVGAHGYSLDTGRVYLFYNDGLNYPTGSASADIIITGETIGDVFSYKLTSGDFNADGKTDLAVGSYYNSSSKGRVYLFYSGSIITENASGADVKITGEAGFDYFGGALSAGDFNADGKTDLVVGAEYAASYGRAYIFYNGSIITENASGADVFITGVTNNEFGYSLVAGDWNADGKTDLAVGNFYYSASKGRVYLFYADGTNNFGTATCSSTPASCSAANADVIITGEAATSFSDALAAGDWNADGKTDLAVGASRYSSFTGRTYIFYGGSIVTEDASGADVIITGGATNDLFSSALTPGDWNADGKTDLAVGAFGYSSSIGRTYIFYNDGSIPTTAASADVIITGQTTNNYFGYSLTPGDFNQDGKTDLAVGAYGYATNTGRVYVYITEARAAPTDQALKIKGTFKTKGGFRVR